MLSIWESGHFHRSPHLVVIGAGITGLFAALFHKRRHPTHHVLVLERGVFPSGATVRNAGFACFGSPSELLADRDKEGEDAMLLRVEERWKGLLELRAELGDENIGFDPSGGHELVPVNSALYTRVAEGFDPLNKLLTPVFGTPPFHWDLNASERLGIAPGHHVVRTALEGALDSGALAMALLRKVQEAGVLFRGAAEVRMLEEQGDGVRITLVSGEAILAGQALLATNGYTPGLLPDTDLKPARGQVLVTEPIPGLRLRGTFHLEEGFHYFRDLVLPGDAPGTPRRVLLGGGRNLDMLGETTAENGLTPIIQDRLEQLLKEIILPDTTFRIAQRWSGIMGFREQGKSPLVERRGERLVIAAGLSGMGVAIGIRVARRGAELLG